MTYLLSFMDKVALSQASIFGILEDDVSCPLSMPSSPAKLTDTAPARHRLQLGQRHLLLWLPGGAVPVRGADAEAAHRAVLWRHDCGLGRRHDGAGGRALVRRARGLPLPARRVRDVHQPRADHPGRPVLDAPRAPDARHGVVGRRGRRRARRRRRHVCRVGRRLRGRAVRDLAGSCFFFFFFFLG